jgi:hypothetical protein
MRLQQYINEEESNIDKILSVLQKDCKPFLKELDSNFVWRGTHRNINAIKELKSRLENRRPSDTDAEVHYHINELFKKKFKWYARNGVFATGNYQIARDYGKPFMFFPIGNFKYVWSPDIEDFFTEIDESDYTNYDGGSDMYDVESDWDEQYGEDQEGHWEYDGKEVDSKDSMEIIDDLGIDPEEFDEYLLSWVPDMSLSDFTYDVEERWDNERDEFYKDLVDLYINKYLKNAIKSRNEIMFNCKSYLLIHGKYAMTIKDELL